MVFLILSWYQRSFLSGDGCGLDYFVLSLDVWFIALGNVVRLLVLALLFLVLSVLALILVLGSVYHLPHSTHISKKKFFLPFILQPLPHLHLPPFTIAYFHFFLQILVAQFYIMVYYASNTP